MKLEHLTEEQINIGKIYFINPNNINYIMKHNIETSKIMYGDWDKELQIFDQSSAFYNSFLEKIKTGKEIFSTFYFTETCKYLKKGIIFPNYSSENEFVDYCHSLDTMFKDISEYGYRQNPDGDEVKVLIGRNGETILFDGEIRLTFAKIVGLNKIPIKIIGRHSEWIDFKNTAINWANEKSGGKVYANLEHFDLQDIPAYYNGERFDAIKPYLRKDCYTTLDLGAHWGFLTSKLEAHGRKCVALEYEKTYIPFMLKLRRANNRNFEVVCEDMFKFIKKRNNFDTIMAINVFHHYLKTELGFNKMVEFLNSLNMKEMIFMTHNPSEKQMHDSYKNFDTDEFVNFIISETCLNNVEYIARIGDRHIYHLTK